MTDNSKPGPITAVEIRSRISADVMRHIGAHKELIAEQSVQQIYEILKRLTKVVRNRFAGQDANRILQIGYEAIIEAFKIGLDYHGLGRSRRARLITSGKRKH
jgi:hypothetical protein